MNETTDPREANRLAFESHAQRMRAGTYPTGKHARPVYDLDAIPEDPALATEPECCS